ncbi:TonB C-terminal domain-containing protein [uncultured Paracoccus sp.]|uniref:TonB C-terminal domain-containing protein n=1 Tax=uncultured Paracoccus sp. TaxID=189685 RepID=UPI0026386E4C|nr:TonB C-terminal domain-containing protein [uncultured Paracoccus sp.]
MSIAAARGEVAGRTGLWLAAGTAVVGAHLLAASWALDRPVAALPDAPEAVYIELAPAPPPAAPPAPQPVEPVLPELQSFSPPEIPQPEPAPEPEPEQVVEPVDPVLPDLLPMPAPDFAEMPPPVVEPPSDTALLASDRPLRRPDRPVVRQRAPEPEPERQRRAEPQREKPRRQQAAERPAPEAQPQQRRQQQASSAAQGNDSSRARAAASPQAVANWQGEVQARVARHMHRANLSGARGTLQATVVVSVAANGRASARLAAGTGNARVDNALARHAGRMPRLPAPPNGQPANLTVPIAITVR